MKPGLCGIRRRTFLADCGMGFTGLALGAILQRQGIQAADSFTIPDGKPHFAPKAKSVIWIFMLGGASHMETFDPKPALNKYAGKTIGETPYRNALESPLTTKNVRQFVAGNRKLMTTIFPMQVGYRKQGKSGIEISDWWPHLGEVVDEISFVRSVWTTDNDHAAQLQFHTGRHVFDGIYPSIGSWVHYGLGTLNENLPQFLVLGERVGTCCGGVNATGASYLGPEHAGVELDLDPENPLPFAFPGSDIYQEEQKHEFQFIQNLDRLASVKY